MKHITILIINLIILLLFCNVFPVDSLPQVSYIAEDTIYYIENVENNENAWGMGFNNPQHTYRSNFSMEGNPGKLLLTKRVTSSFIYTYPVVDENNNIYLSNQSYLVSYFPNMTIKWERNFPGLDRQTAALDNNNNLLIRDNQGFLYCFNKNNGSLIWMKNETFTSNPTIGYDGNVYIILNFTKLIKMSVDSNEIWNASILPDNTSTLQPTLDVKGNIYITSYPPKDKQGDFIGIPSLYCFFNNGTLKWRSEFPKLIRRNSSPPLTPGYVQETIIVSGKNDRLYFSSWDLYSVYSENGTIEWQKQLYLNDNPIGLTSNGLIIVTQNNGYVSAIDLSGKQKWSVPILRSSAILIDKNDNIFFGGVEFTMLNKTGSVLWKKTYSNTGSEFPIMNRDGEIIICSSRLSILGWTPPMKPEEFKCVSGDEFVSLSWNPPSDNGGAEILDYTLYRGSEEDNLSLFLVLDGNINSYNDTDVENGKTYYYSISTRNRIGVSGTTSVISATPLSIPSAPRNIRIWIESNNNHLEWDPPDDLGGTPLVNYRIYRGTDQNDLTFLCFQDPAETSKNDGTVNLGVMYYYAVSAANKVGESPRTDIVQSILRFAPTPPRNVTTASGTGFINVSWRSPEQSGGSEIIRYELFKNIGYGEFSLLGTFSPDVNSYNDTSVENGVLYHYKIRCNNSYFNSQFSNEVSGYPATVPGSPINLTVHSGNEYIEVSWEPPEFDGGYDVTSYFIEKEYAESGTFIDEFKINTLKMNDTNVVNSISYRYRVRAVNQIGTSPSTDWVVGIPAGVPTIPTNGQIRNGDGFVLITWDAPARDGGSPILGYRIYRNDSLIVELDSSQFEFNDTNVQNGVTYQYVITSYNVQGESSRVMILYGSPAGPSPGEDDKYPPGIPENLRYRLSQEKIILNWDKPDYVGTSEILGYYIYLRVGETGPFVLIGDVRDQEFTDSNGSKPGVYYYRVSAVNSDGEGNKTEELKVEIKEEVYVKGTSVLFYVIPGIISLLVIILVVLLVLRKKAKEPRPDVEEQPPINESFVEDNNWPSLEG